MPNLSKFLPAFALCAVFSTVPALAQDSGTTTEPEAPTADAPATEAEAAPATPGSDLALGEEVADSEAPGTTYTKEEHGDWDVRCIRTEDGNDPCQLYQLLQDTNGNSVAELSMFALPAGEKAAAGATIAVPLETLLTQQITLTIDGGQPKRYPFSWCSQIGCFARVGFTAPEVSAFKSGKTAKVVIVPVVAPEQKVDLNISLKGFTAGYDAVAAINAQ